MADWDVVVIGGGAAGLTAAAEVACTGLSCLVIDRAGGGSELMNLGGLHDCDEALTGPDLAARLLEEAMTAGAELDIGEVTGLVPDAAGWRVSTDNGPHAALTVILATGLAPGTLGLDGESDFEGRGLSHCATCDGPLYRDQPVVVAGADRWAQQEARDLTAIASAVTLVSQQYDPPSGAEAFAVLRGRIVALEGESGLEAVLVQLDDSSAPMRLPARVVFVQTARRPALAFAPETLARDATGRVIADVNLQTNLPGLFVAGDVRAGASRTVAAAMADGRCTAASARAALPSLGSPLGKDAD